MKCWQLIAISSLAQACAVAVILKIYTDSRVDNMYQNAYETCVAAKSKEQCDKESVTNDRE